MAEIAILNPGPGWSYVCDGAVSMSADQSTIQGACACGWLTEDVPRRYAADVLALSEQHVTDAGTAMREYLSAKYGPAASTPPDHTPKG